MDRSPLFGPLIWWLSICYWLQSTLPATHRLTLQETKRHVPQQKGTTSGLGSFNEKLLSEGLSEKAVSLISDSRRLGTINHYELSWRKWESSCSQKGFDPIRSKF